MLPIGFFKTYNYDFTNLIIINMKTKHGGKRENAGRKAMPDNQVKKPITIYVSDDQVAKFGSRDDLRDILMDIVTQVNKDERVGL